MIARRLRIVFRTVIPLGMRPISFDHHVVVIEGVRVPMLLDTGAEVTILPSDFLNRLCPGQELPDRGGQ